MHISVESEKARRGEVDASLTHPLPSSSIPRETNDLNRLKMNSNRISIVETNSNLILVTRKIVRKCVNLRSSWRGDVSKAVPQYFCIRTHTLE